MKDLANGNLTHNPNSAQNLAISALVLHLKSHLATLFHFPSLKPCLLLHFKSGFHFYCECWIWFYSWSCSLQSSRSCLGSKCLPEEATDRVASVQRQTGQSVWRQTLHRESVCESSSQVLICLGFEGCSHPCWNFSSNTFLHHLFCFIYFSITFFRLDNWINHII